MTDDKGVILGAAILGTAFILSKGSQGGGGGGGGLGDVIDNVRESVTSVVDRVQSVKESSDKAMYFYDRAVDTVDGFKDTVDNAKQEAEDIVNSVTGGDNSDIVESGSNAGITGGRWLGGGIVGFAEGLVGEAAVHGAHWAGRDDVNYDNVKAEFHKANSAANTKIFSAVGANSSGVINISAPKITPKTVNTAKDIVSYALGPVGIITRKLKLW